MLVCRGVPGDGRFCRCLGQFDEGPISMEEREFYDERQETRKTTLTCPHCHQSAEYDLSLDGAHQEAQPVAARR